MLDTKQHIGILLNKTAQRRAGAVVFISKQMILSNKYKSLGGNAQYVYDIALLNSEKLGTCEITLLYDAVKDAMSESTFIRARQELETSKYIEKVKQTRVATSSYLRSQCINEINTTRTKDTGATMYKVNKEFVDSKKESHYALYETVIRSKEYRSMNKNERFIFKSMLLWSSGRQKFMFPSSLSKTLGMDPKTLRTNIDGLVKLGVIEKLKSGGEYILSNDDYNFYTELLKCKHKLIHTISKEELSRVKYNYTYVNILRDYHELILKLKITEQQFTEYLTRLQENECIVVSTSSIYSKIAVISDQYLRTVSTYKLKLQ